MLEVRSTPRRLLVIAQLAGAVPTFALAIVTLLGVVSAWQVFSLAFLMGVARGFEMPVRQAFVPSLVKRQDLPNAIALNSILFNLARL